MDKFTKKLEEEMSSWFSDLVTDSDLSTEELFERYSYEYCIRKEIVDYFRKNVIEEWFKSFLLTEEELNEEDTLSYLYSEYMKYGTAGIQNEVVSFIDKFVDKLQELRTLVKSIVE